MRRLFLDTGFLIAATSRQDVHHGKAVEILRRLTDHEWPYVATSDFVVAEALNFLAKRIKRVEAANAVVGLVFGSDISPPIATEVIRIHAGRFAAALANYSERFQMRLSFTDWTNVEVMRELRMTEIATFDKGFQAIGFTAVPGRPR